MLNEYDVYDDVLWCEGGKGDLEGEDVVLSEWFGLCKNYNKIWEECNCYLQIEVVKLMWYNWILFIIC